MTDPTHQHDPLVGEPIFHCPTCRAPPLSDSLTCPRCSFGGTVRHGIPSFVADEDDNSIEGIGEGDLESLVGMTTDRSIRVASQHVLRGHDDRNELAGELFDVRRDAWVTIRPVIATGRCLDLSAGFGRRSMVLGELASSVYGVDTSLSKLRVLDARSDYESSSRVIPIHASRTTLPFPDNYFDTIVADLRHPNDKEIHSTLNRLRAYLSDGGTTVCIVDGMTRGLAAASHRDESRVERLQSYLPNRLNTPETLVSQARKAGFEHVEVYAPFPTETDPLFVLDVGDAGSTSIMSKLIRAGGTIRSRSASKLLDIVDSLGLFERLLPSYVLVCHTVPPSSRRFDEPLVIPGRARTVVLDSVDGTIDRVWKIPNRRAHAPLTEREHAVLSYLHTRDDSIISTIPHGGMIETEFGATRIEEPVDGSRLSEGLGDDIASFDTVLRRGFEWLIEFQRTYRGDPFVRAPADVREDLSFEPADVEPPPIDEPVETFLTPVHGDFTSQNIHVRDGSVAGVIDWEYSAIEANPVIDAGFLVLDTANLAFGGFEEAYRGLFQDWTDHAQVARGWIETYCDALDLPVETFERYLPSVYLHRLELDWRFGAVSTFTSKMENRSDLVKYMLDNPIDLSSRDSSLENGYFSNPRACPSSTQLE